MTTPKKRSRKLWKTLGIGLGVAVTFGLLFVVAFVFNPLEGDLPDVRDVVPRGVDFFVRKTRLAGDFADFPAPKFWAELADSRGWPELEKGPLVRDLADGGAERALQQARDAVQRVAADSGGWIDVLRDAIGTELVVAGYVLDRDKSPPQPLAVPRWCVYTRVGWRVKAALGLAGFGFVQARLQGGGAKVAGDGLDLVVELPGQPGPLYVRRHLDVVMVANDRGLVEQSQRLIDGNRDEEPLGKMAAYTDGVVQRVERWADVNSVFVPNSLEFVAEPNAFDGWKRRAANWPNAANKDSMNERVLASFLNLKGWMQVSGALLFADQTLAATGQVVLNSKQHTPFQSSFYKAEKQRRQEWLDPFLRMVPENACAAAALRMPAGEFLHAMFGALEPEARELVDDGMRRSVLQGQALSGTTDLIERLKIALWPRTGFVFRRNQPDPSRDPQTGELMVPVTARSPMPQVAWVFWLRPGAGKLVEDLVAMLRDSYGNFGFRKVWHLKVPYAGGQLAEPVTEFCNPQIPATGQIAMIVFSDFFVVSNSGLLIKDVLRTRYAADGMRSIRSLAEFGEVERELPAELNGMVWLRGSSLVTVMDDYLNFAAAGSEMPDPEWMVTSRPAAEDYVRKTRFPQYPSKASLPRALTQPGGEFDTAVVAHLHELWRRERTSFTAADRADMQQLRAFAQLLNAGYVQVELENNYIRFQAKLLGNLR
ncbi:MAG: hypothetical protein FJ265_05365 [Planctomycetes bacterium]|nr:hypothetical protein [Planctomycetota bacterium]